MSAVVPVPMSRIAALWARVHEPKAVSVIYFILYSAGVGAGIYSTIHPPGSIEGQIGSTAMTILTVLLAFGCTIGAISALPGVYWLERTAVASIALSTAIYLGIVVTLHFQTSGSRILQAWAVLFVLGLQAVRWVRVRERPYRPDLPTADDV